VTSCSSSSGGAATTTTTEQFVGTVEGSTDLVGLAVTDGQALLFFCGAGATLTTSTHWMRGAVTVGQAFSLSDTAGASATGDATATVGATHLTGTFKESSSAASTTWSADLVTAGSLAGLYTDPLSEGLVSLIVLPPEASGAPVAQGAFHETALNGDILQVTPIKPLARTAAGVAVDVDVSGATEKVFLTPAVGD
jgi:hypothetical protein